MRNYLDMLRDHDHGWMIDIPPTPLPAVSSDRPSHLLLFHPSIGPLWEVMRQKLGSGRLGYGAEMVIDCSEVRFTQMRLDGSLRVLTEKVRDTPTLFSHQHAPRCRLEDCTIVNEGVDYEDPANQFWRYRVMRRESLTIHLEGDAEFDARGCVLRGHQTFRVPSGYRMTVRPKRDTSGAAQSLEVDMTAKGESPSWCWSYKMSDEGEVTLTLQE
jgi:UTP---glucose-1-phosphate uridylyltransferase